MVSDAGSKAAPTGGSRYEKPFPDSELDIVDPSRIRVCCNRNIEACGTIRGALGREVPALGIPNWFSLRNRDPRNRRRHRDADPALEKNGCRNLDDHHDGRPLHSRSPWRVAASDPAGSARQSGLCERPLVCPQAERSLQFRGRL